ncbi:MAG: hypothetical protein HON65_02285 [Rhodospirillales bacterium]|jgi:hypothetical protein|nr:hypothetical protein [Rhodospirillales bacterium]
MTFPSFSPLLKAMSGPAVDKGAIGLIELIEAMIDSAKATNPIIRFCESLEA